MAVYPGTEREARFAAIDLIAFATAVFRSCGMDDADATQLATMLVDADLRGVHSHGVMRVPDYVGKLTTGGVDPRGRPRFVREHGATAVVDGGNAMGQIAGVFAMRHAIGLAREHGTGTVAVGHSNHCGAMDFYVREAIAAGMIGIATTNALPTMAPWGGVDKIVGLNPIGIGIPAGEEEPFVLDAALGMTAHGKLRIYKQKGEPIPAGWAFDKEGRPTTDIDAALDGLIQPIGGPKGIGLAIAMGVLSTLLSGAGYGTESGNMVDGPYPGKDGQFYLAIDPVAFVDRATFRARMDVVIRQYARSRPAEGVARLYVPGALEAELSVEHRERGIPLNAETVAQLAAVAASRGVELMRS